MPTGGPFDSCAGLQSPSLAQECFASSPLDISKGRAACGSPPAAADGAQQLLKGVKNVRVLRIEQGFEMIDPSAVRGAPRLEKLTAWHMPHTQSSGAPPARPASPAPAPAVGCGAMLYSNFRISPCSARSWRPGASISARASSTLAKSCTQGCALWIPPASCKRRSQICRQPTPVKDIQTVPVNSTMESTCQWQGRQNHLHCPPGSRGTCRQQPV